MTTYIVYSKLSDGFHDGTTVTTNGATLYAGKFTFGSQPRRSFMSFDTSAIPDTDHVESAALVFNSLTRSSAGNIYAMKSTWEPTVTTADTYDSTQIYGKLPASGSVMPLDRALISLTASTQLAIFYAQNGTLPGDTQSDASANYYSWASADSNPTALVIATSPKSALYGFDKASVQLPTSAKNGEPTVASIRRNSSSSSTVTLGYYNLNSTTFNTIANIGSPAGQSLDVSQDGPQNVALATDSVGNLFVFGQYTEALVGQRDSKIYVQPYRRTGTSTWTLNNQDEVAISIPASINPDGTPSWVTQQIAVTYLPLADVIQVVISDNEGSAVYSGYITVANLLANPNSSNLPVFSLNTLATSVVPASPIELRPTGLDIVSFPDATSGRYMVSGRGTRAMLYSSSGFGSLISMNEYPVQQKLLASQSTTISRWHSGANIAAGVQDGIYRTILPTSGSGAGSTSNLILGSMLWGGSAGRAWDAVYSSAANAEWVFYVPTTNNGRDIHLAFVSPSSNSVLSTGTVIATNLGAVGSVVTGIRVTSNAADDRSVVVEYSLLSSAGVTTMGAVLWAPQFVGLPNAPALFPRAAYSSTSAGLFSWTFSDPNARDTQRGYQLVVATAAVPGTPVYDSTQLTSGTSSHTIPGSTLANNTNFVWRVRVQDQTGFWGSWSADSAFSTTDSGAVVIVTPSADNLPTDKSYVDVEWTYSSTSGMTQSSYRVKLIRVSDGTTLSDTGNVTSSATSYQVTGLASDVVHRIEVSVISNLGISSIVDTVLVTPDYDTPLQPLIDTAVYPNYIEISISNPDAGSRPPAARNEIWKRTAGSTGLRRRVGYVVNGGVYQDFEVASGVQYEYEVRSVSAAETFATSDVFFETGAILEGVWVHQPFDPAGTSKQYMYGNIGRSEDLSVGATQMNFIGRSKPVFEFTIDEEQTLSLEFDIPNGSTLSSDVEYIRNLVRAREIICYRDNRQRLLYGFLTGVSITDVAYGYKVSGTLTTAEHTDVI